MRLFAIGFVWVGCAFAWMVLGATIEVRTGDSSTEMQEEVTGLWGPELHQAPPHASFQERRTREEVTWTEQNGQQTRHVTEHVEHVAVPIELASSDMDVALSLEHRRKGLLWFPTYDVTYRGTYEFVNRAPEGTLGVARDINFVFPLPTGASSGASSPSSESRRYSSVRAAAVLDGFRIENADGAEVDVAIAGNQATWTARLEPGERRRLTVTYASRGTSSFTYGGPSGLGTHGERVRAFRLNLATNFADIDFPAGTLSPTRHGTTDGGWEGAWEFDSLVSGQPIGISLPRRLNPGPLAARITFFAPVGLLFFFFVVAILAEARKKSMHPMHYLLMGCAFFAFHLLFAYLVDHLSILPAFVTASVVSLALVTTYARLFVGWRFSLTHVGIPQAIYLVLFSYTFFWKGFTGLAVTIGAVVTLFVIMQITGRVQWSDVIARKGQAAANAANAADAQGGK